MRVSLFLFIILFNCILISGNVHAQTWQGNIDSLKLLPAIPTSTDTIRVVCYSKFPHLPCMLLSSAISINDTIISVSATHFHGLYATICNSTDTLEIGYNFPPGNYTLFYNLTDSLLGIVDRDTLYFTMPFLTSELNITKSCNVQLIPNPASDIFSIDLRGKHCNISSVEIISLNGEHVLPEYNNLLICNQMNIYRSTGLSKGIYIVKINIDGESLVRGLIKN